MKHRPWVPIVPRLHVARTQKDTATGDLTENLKSRNVQGGTFTSPCSLFLSSKHWQPDYPAPLKFPPGGLIYPSGSSRVLQKKTSTELINEPTRGGQALILNNRQADRPHDDSHKRQARRTPSTPNSAAINPNKAQTRDAHTSKGAKAEVPALRKSPEACTA